MIDRRGFLVRVAAGLAGITVGVGGAKASLHLDEASARETRSVNYQVKGFSCITCAAGLEVILRQQKGVVRASATYPEARVTIGFDETLTSEDKLKDFIASSGFTVA
jgi:copper chaperone CopZ